jgi:hypothetical protein
VTIQGEREVPGMFHPVLNRRLLPYTMRTKIHTTPT